MSNILAIAFVIGLGSFGDDRFAGESILQVVVVGYFERNAFGEAD